MKDERPVKETEIMGCLAPTFVLLGLEEAVEEFRANLLIQQKQINTQFEVLKAFSDLYTEMTEETEKRKWLGRLMKRIEREASRTRLDLWFWRPEKELTLEQQVRRRISHLRAEKYSLDDVWDLICEFVTEWAHKDLDQEWLKTILRESYAKQNAD